MIWTSVLLNSDVNNVYIKRLVECGGSSEGREGMRWGRAVVIAPDKVLFQ